MMMRSCAVAAATPSTRPRTFTRPSWPPRMMSRSERPIPPRGTSASCSGFAGPAGCGSGSAIVAIFAVARLAGPGRLGLAAGAAAVHHEVGVADHELVLVGDVMQHRHHVVPLDVQRGPALVADQVVMLDPLFVQLVVGAVTDPRLLDQTELFQNL